MIDASLDRETLVPETLPDWKTLFGEGRSAGQRIAREPTRSNQSNQVSSQREWADRCVADQCFRTQMNIGLPTWDLTEAALEQVTQTFLQEGLRPPDAYQLILERRMGLPATMRADAPQETGPVLWTERDWNALGSSTPIQPQAPLIGTPASFENVCKGLAAGLDTIGNFANFVLHYPYFDDESTQLSSVVKALGAVSVHADHGVVVDSYLEDGHCGTFEDYRSVLGWALMERHIVETLCDVPFALAFGGLTGDPLERCTIYRALELCTTPQTLRYGYIHGSTVTHTDSHEQNLAAFIHDVTLSLAAIHHYRWGSAYLAVPLTERERVPSVEETIEVHRLARHAEEQARSLAQHIDWSIVEAGAKELAACGVRWFERLNGALEQGGIDTGNPLELMLATRRITPHILERVGLDGESGPARPTELTQITNRATEAASTQVQCRGLRCDGVRVVVASTDVHWPAKSVLEYVLAQSGAIVVDGGLAADPQRLVQQAVTEDCTAVAVTTHNGWALNFGERLVASLPPDRDLTVIMGGILNEDAGPGANTSLPRDVSAELNQLGIVTTNDFATLVKHLAQVI